VLTQDEYVRKNIFKKLTQKNDNADTVYKQIVKVYFSVKLTFMISKLTYILFIYRRIYILKYFNFILFVHF